MWSRGRVGLPLGSDERPSCPCPILHAAQYSERPKSHAHPVPGSGQRLRTCISVIHGCGIWRSLCRYVVGVFFPILSKPDLKTINTLNLCTEHREKNCYAFRQDDRRIIDDNTKLILQCMQYFEKSDY